MWAAGNRLGNERGKRGSGRRQERGGRHDDSGAVCVLALPSAVLAFSTKFESPVGAAVSKAGNLDSPSVAGTGPRLARAVAIAIAARGLLFPFTPAKNPNRPDRSVTVAVRLDPQAIKTVTVMASGAAEDAAGSAKPLRIAQTGFNLGVARGYHNFAQDILPLPSGRKAELPDLSRFVVSPDATRSQSRVRPADRDRRQTAGRPGSAHVCRPGGSVDLGGSYRVTPNLKVTAGVRYSEDRERLRPLTDGNQDSQAVYVGTQFRF